MKVKYILSLLISILLFGSVISAQSTLTQQKKIQQLQQQLDALKDKQRTVIDPYAHQGLYAEGTLGSNAAFLWGGTNNTLSSDSAVNGIGSTFAMGYRPHLNGYAIELGFAYAEFGINVDTKSIEKEGEPFVPSRSVEVNQPLNGIYLASRWQAHFTPQFSWITKLGVMSVHTSKITQTTIDGKKFALEQDDQLPSFTLPFVGIGVSYDITSKLAVSVQYQGAVYIALNAGILSGGLTYNFE